jgi:hypothetical protein
MNVLKTDLFKRFFTLKSHKIEFSVFVILFIYLLLRAIYVPPLHDEVATYFHYIESGKFFTRDMILDANNHVLNSFLCRILYRIHDGSFFWFRLPNLIAFVVYFWSTFKLLSKIKSQFTRIILLSALNTTPFVLEYFALCRGYGLGLGFFLLSLVYIKRYLHQSNSKNLTLSLLFSTLSIYANLIFINSFLLTLMLLFLVFLLKRKQFSVKHKMQFISIFMGCLIASAPMFVYSFALKTGGALYYGSLEGIWDVTGKSLFEHTLFYASDGAMLLITALLFLLLIRAVLSLLSSKSILLFFQDTQYLFIYFLLGNVFASIFLAEFLSVNYPEDRAAIHLIPLSILTGGFVFNALNKNYISLLFLFFPISLLFNLNLSTSIVTPDQRLNPQFYAKVRKEVNDKNILVYPTSALNWAYYERNQSEKKLIQSRQEIDTCFDYIMTRETLYENLLSPKKYTLFAFEPLSKTYVFKRKKSITTQKNQSHTVHEYWGKDEFIPIYEMEVNHDDQLKLHLAHIQGKMQIDSAYNTISMVFTTENDKQEAIFYDSFQLRWFFGSRKLHVELNGKAVFPTYNNAEKRIKIYIWNPSKRVIKLNKTKITFSYRES